MTILVDRAPLPTRKAESAGRIWLPGIAGVAAALSLAALLWLILLRIGTATKLGALLAVDTAEQLAFDTGQVQPFVAETSGAEPHIRFQCQLGVDGLGGTLRAPQDRQNGDWLLFRRILW